MIETKYGLKYPFPHTLVHIVDNSSYTGELPVTIADEPSMYGTIVVTGLPMGEDRRMIDVKRSDILNVAYGLSSLTITDIRKFSQSATYPLSLINQGSPVKLLRVTPDDATYAYSIVTIEWRKDTTDNQIHVRYNTERFAVDRALANYANRERLNAAIVKSLEGATTEAPATDPTGERWKKRAFIVNISAGRGAAYNRFATTISKVIQGRNPANVKYTFATIDTNTTGTVEQFIASLINVNNGYRTDATDSVNVQMKRRMEGSSVVVPYVNESAIEELYNDYRAHLAECIEEGATIADNPVMTDDYISSVALKLTINTFDVIFGNYIYNGTDDAYKLPFFQVDMRTSDIAELPTNQRIYVVDEDLYIEGETDADIKAREYQIVNKRLENSTAGITNDSQSVHVGDVYLYSGLASNTNPYMYVVAAINQYTGAVTTVKMNMLINLESHLKSYDGTSAYNPNETIESTLAVVITPAPNPTPEASFRDMLRRAINNGKVHGGDTVVMNAIAEDGTIKNELVLYYVLKQYGTVPKTIEEYAKEDWSSPDSIWRNYLKLIDVDALYDVINWDSANMSAGTGNVIGIKSNDGTTTSAWRQPGAAVIISRHGDLQSPTFNTRDTAVYVNNYDITVSSITNEMVSGDDVDGTPYAENPIGRTLVPTVKFVFSKPPVTILDSERASDLLNTEYDIIVMDEEDLKYKFSRTGSYVNGTITNTDGIMVHGDGTFNNDELPAEIQDKALIFVLHVPGSETSGAHLVYTITGREIGGETIIPTKTSDIKIAFVTPDGKETLFAVPDKKNRTIADYAKLTLASGVSNAHDVDYADFVKQAHEFELQTGTNITIRPSSPKFRLVYDKYVDPTTKLHYPVNITRYATGSGDDIVVKVNMEASAMVPDVTDDIIPEKIERFMISSTQGNYWRIAKEEYLMIPPNYYSSAYGVDLTPASGGIRLEDGSTGFFDDTSISSIEFKWMYSALLVKAFKGEIDPRIMSPTRVPAKYMFDFGSNTIVGQTILPYLSYTAQDKIQASTIFTEDEKDSVAYDQSKTASLDPSDDIDVKQAMYDLLIYRIYQGIPEDKRPIGPGSGMSLYLDAGVTDAQTAMLIKTSFDKRFDNPNASWDIGGYVSSTDGMSYTYTKRIVENLIGHCKSQGVNKPFTGNFTTIRSDEFVSFFPDVDATDWDLRELMYNSGGNAWIIDQNGNLSRRSQRTMHRASSTSDLLQESNMRTLSQLVYILQNFLDQKLFEYDDDAVLKTIQEDCNTMFSNWVGKLVQGLNIALNRDINIDGGEIVVCTVNVTFRGLILRIPIIVNVNRRTETT